jgi:hypothetical protein
LESPPFVFIAQHRVPSPSLPHRRIGLQLNKWNQIRSSFGATTARLPRSAFALTSRGNPYRLVAFAVAEGAVAVAVGATTIAAIAPKT